MSAANNFESESHRQTHKPDMKDRVRYAVVGLGYISQAAILPAFANAKETSELTALVSGDKTKLKTLAKKYKVSKTYSYEEFSACLASGEVDAVYIALPNSMHRAYAEGAARAGIHVLCEKPMAVTGQECEAMIDVASNANVKLMIAYRLHFEKGNLSAIGAIQKGKIGEPRIFRSAFCQQVPKDNTRLKEELGGGPLYDIGIYCINAARYLFRAEPEEVFAYGASAEDERFREVEEMTTAVLRFPGHRLASFTCSFGAADRSAYEVIGTKGILRMDPAYEMTGDLRCEISIDDRVERVRIRQRDQFGPELIYFSKCILEDKEPEPGGREGLADVRIIKALLESQQHGRPVKLAPLEMEKRPNTDQEIHKPAVRKPVLVKAASPSE